MSTSITLRMSKLTQKSLYRGGSVCFNAVEEMGDKKSFLSLIEAGILERVQKER